MGRNSKLENEGVSHAGDKGYVSVVAERVGNLSTIGDVRAEMAKIYKLVRKGILKIHEGNQLVYILSQIVFAARAEFDTKQIDKNDIKLPEQPNMDRVQEILAVGEEPEKAA